MTPESSRHSAFAANFTRLADGVTDWTAPTPVKEWQATDVVDHLLTWLPPVLDAWAALPHTDRPDDDLPTRWRRRTHDIQDILDDPERADREIGTGPFAGRTVAQTIDAIYTSDIYMHSWDLARSTNQDPQLDPAFAVGQLEGMRSMRDIIRSSGQFGEEQPTTSDRPVDQLMAFIGRNPDWRP